MDPSTPKGPIKYKFIRRTMNTDRSHLAAPYTKMRRIYFRKIYAFSEECRRLYSYSTRKQLNCLTDLETTLAYRLCNRKVVKNLKNLKSINISIWSDSPIGSLILHIKELPKSIEIITICGNIRVSNPAQIESLYRNLSSLRKLRRFEKDLGFVAEDQEPNNLTEIEYNSINKYIPRLGNLKELSCVELREGEQGLHRFMSQDRECRSVTGLSLNMFDVPFASLFLFQVFPRLNRLDLQISGMEMSLDSSIIQGLKSLTGLKQFTLDIPDRFSGIKFLFKGLSHLPLLDSFCLSISHIENNEELLLMDFLQQQNRLISLVLTTEGSLESRERYEQQNRNLETICQSLSGMPRLKYLSMEGSAWSLESLSRGLSHFGLTNQLKELTIEVFDDISIMSSSSPDSKVKGLCDFIGRQRSSLRALYITIACVKEDDIVANLIKTIGEADHLESLRLSVNVTYTESSLGKNRLLQDIPRESLKGHPLSITLLLV